jgi:hypothetical protein
VIFYALNFVFHIFKIGMYRTENYEAFVP